MPLLYNLYVQGHYIKGEEVPQWHENRKMAAIGDKATARVRQTQAVQRRRHIAVTRVARATARVRPYNIRTPQLSRIL